jgi:peptide/nickel transport system ATP-binding protein
MSAPHGGADYTMKANTMPLLHVDQLAVEFDTESGPVRAVDGVSLAVRRGETLGVVGESGCGKSVTALSVMRLLPTPPARIAAGSIRWEGRDLLRLPIRELRALRGREISMIFQDPMSALSPLHSIGRQLTEAVLLHRPVSAAEAWALGESWLGKVGLPDPAQRMKSLPHELSGGMRQRVMIAMAMMLEPSLLIADEPTTALDVTIQAQIFDLMRQMRDATHLAAADHARHGRDLGNVRRVLVMYAGRVVEEGPVAPVFAAAAPSLHHRACCVPCRARQAKGARLISIPGPGSRAHRMPAGCRFADRCPHVFARCRTEDPALQEVGDGTVGRLFPGSGGTPPMSAPLRRKSKHLSTWYPIRRGVLARTVGHVQAVNDVSLTLAEGETLGLVGESGCGKTTLGRTSSGWSNRTRASCCFRG